MRPSGRAAVAIAVSVIAGGLAGCLTLLEPESVGIDPAGAGIGGRPVVVAVIDSGIDPYHDAFAATEDGPRVEDIAISIGANLVSLASAGTLEDRLAADSEFWTGVEDNRLYAFAGTRVLVVSHVGAGPPVGKLRAGYDGDHGTAVASVVTQQAPHALVVGVQTWNLCLPERIDCLAHPSLVRGIRWAAAQPWVDVIVMSLQVPGNLPVSETDFGDIAAATREAAAAGKTIVVSGGNDPSVVLADPFDGPPWVISVGGAEPTQAGRTNWAAYMTDVVANFTEFPAYGNTLDEHRRRAGTSFAAPNVAAALAEAIHLVRTAPEGTARDPSPIELRRALNASAIYFAATDYDPTRAHALNDSDPYFLVTDLILSSTAPIVAPAAQTGWGYVSSAIAPEIARRVLERDYAPPAQKAEAVALTTAWHDARRGYWDAAGD